MSAGLKKLFTAHEVAANQEFNSRRLSSPPTLPHRHSNSSSASAGSAQRSAGDGSDNDSGEESNSPQRASRASAIVRQFQAPQTELRRSTYLSSDSRRSILRPSVQREKRDKNEVIFFNQIHHETLREHTELLAYTRSFLTQMLVEALEGGFWGGMRLEAPATRHLSGTVLSLEIVGMFRLTTYLLHRLNGEMHVGKFLDRFYTWLVDIVVSYRGDIVQFAGDSLVVFFEAANDHEHFRNVCGSSHCCHTPEELSCLRATACCLEVHKQLKTFDMGVADAGPTVSIANGISAGTVTLIGLNCGRAAEGTNVFLQTVGGSPMRHASSAAQIAVRLGEPATVFTPQAWKLVANIVVEGPAVADHPEFRRLAALDVKKHTYPMVRHAAQLSFMPRIHAIKDFDAETVDRRLAMSMQFLHHSVRTNASAGSGAVAESRKVSLAFVRVSGVDATIEDGSHVLGKLAACLQESCRSEEGCFWKLTLDDQGILFYFVWGLPPLVHLDDSKRACKACFAMVLKAVDMGLACKVGIVTDRLFCGAIGSEKRREYSVIGSAVQGCASISSAADFGLVLVDEATRQECRGALEFVPLDAIVGGPCLEPIAVFQMLPPRSGDGNIDLPTSTRQSSPTAFKLSQSAKALEPSCAANGVGSMSPSKMSRHAPVIFSPPCTPPWLESAGRRAEKIEVCNSSAPVFPTLWTSVWCERTPRVPVPPLINGVSAESVPNGAPSASLSDQESWTIHVPVPLPWPARSIACGGVSPVPSFTSWKMVTEAEHRVIQLHADGGGLLPIVGPFGSGKTELAEHLVCSAARNKKMQPIFGAMEMRSGHELSAIRAVLRGALALLEPSGQIKSDDALQYLMAKAAINLDEHAALERAGLTRPSARENFTSALQVPPLASSARSGTHELGSRQGSLQPCSHASRQASSNQLTPTPSPSPRPSLLIPSPTHSKLGANGSRRSRSNSIASTNSFSSFLSDKLNIDGFGPSATILVGMAKRLIHKLLQDGPVVVTLRVSQGTSRMPIDLSSFWLLVHALEVLANTRGPSTYELLVIVVCQKQHLDGAVEKHRPQAIPLHVRAFGRAEIKSYVHLCLGLVEPNEFEESDTADPVVPHELVDWLARIADVPRYVEECLTQLHRSNTISVADGRCTIKAPMENVRVADWLNTNMVARVVSEAEALSPEKQQVLIVATTLQGPFSTLDLAAANRMSTTRGLPRALIMRECVKRITACLDLADVGLLRPVGPADNGEDATAGSDWMSRPSSPNRSVSERSRGSGYHGDAPSWYIPSVLIHQVIGSSLFQSHRMELKRAILVTRAIRHEARRQSVCSLSVDFSVERKTRKRRRGHILSWHHSSVDEYQRDIPISCLVVPRVDQDTDEEGEQGEEQKSECGSGDGHGRLRSQVSVITSNAWQSEATMNFADTNQVVELADFLPMTFFRRFAWFRLCYTLIIACFGTELTIMLDSSQDALDAFLLVAAIFIFWDFLVLECASKSYFRNLFAMCNLLLLALIFGDISWALGMKSDQLLVWRRQSGAMIRVMCFFGKFAACSCRLSAEIQTAANWLYRHPLCMWLSRGCWFSGGCRRSRSEKNQVSKFAIEEDVSNPVQTKMLPSAQLADLGNKVGNAVLLTLTVFTVLTTGSLWLVDYSYYPDEDASMQAWALMINNYLVNGTTLTGGVNSQQLNSEIRFFEQFYREKLYGPFSLCTGSLAASSGNRFGIDDRCSNLLWRSASGDFSQPTRAGFQVEVQSGTLWAAFDFTDPARKEALLRFFLMLSLLVLTFGIAVSINALVTSNVIAPLIRVFSTVHMISEKLKEHVPGFSDENFDADDEVSMLEQAVEKLAVYVGQDKDQKNEPHNEWISPQHRKDAARRADSNLEIGFEAMAWHNSPEHSADQDRRDQQVLASMDVSLEEVNSWNFNVLILERFQLEGVTAWLLLRKVDGQFNLQVEVVANYVRLIANGYHDQNPYHCWKHAVDVHYTLHHCCDNLRVHHFLTPLDTFAVAVAAIAHDVGHPGYNNIFLEQTSNELALRYNDRSPLENMHCATMFGLMQSHPEAQIFEGLNKKKYKEARQVCVEVILHTDNAKHFDMVKDLNMFYMKQSEIFEQPGAVFGCTEEAELFRQEPNRRFVLNALMHGSDISNACKPWKICMSWAELVLSEFFLQGDEEKRLGIPVQMNRDTLNKPTSQLLFIEFFVLPFNKSLVRIFAPLWQLTDFLQANLQIWHLHRNAEVEMDDDKRREANQKIHDHSEELKALVQKSLSRSSYEVSKVDSDLREVTRRLQAKNDPFGRAAPVMDERFIQSSTTPRVEQHHGQPSIAHSETTRTSETRRSSHSGKWSLFPRTAAKGELRISVGSHEGEEETGPAVPLPGTLHGDTDQAGGKRLVRSESKEEAGGKRLIRSDSKEARVLHHPPPDAPGAGSPVLSDITSLQTRSPPPDMQNAPSDE